MFLTVQLATRSEKHVTYRVVTNGYRIPMPEAELPSGRTRSDV